MTKNEVLKKLEEELYALHDEADRVQRKIDAKEKMITRVEGIEDVKYREEARWY